LSEEPQVAANGPLSGVRVVELASVLMAPYTTQILGDLGAEIIKVEPPTGDTNRYMGNGPHPELSGIAMNLHRNKRSVVLDLKQPAAQEALRRLVGRADVLVTNLRPVALDEFGLDYESLSATNPGLVYCEAHGFRSDTSEADEPAFDDTIQALCGIPALVGDMGLETRFLPVLIADKVTGLTILYAVLAALYERERSGVGQRVEVPMFDSILSFTLAEHLAQAVLPGQPPGYSRALSLNRGPHQTSDGWLALMPYTNRQWRTLYEAVGCAHLLDEPWHKDMATRLVEADKAYGELKEIIRQRSTAEWLEICRVGDIPVAPVPRLAEIVEDPALHRGVLREAVHPAVGTYRQIAPPAIFSRTPSRELAENAPLLGEHTHEVLAELGLSDSEIAELRQPAAATAP
jgi:crotonobetainyl-CoA:carnitine CoA-transferase CaiB-like acyl-CoA transferase